MVWLRRVLGWLLPRSERALILRELDEVLERRQARAPGAWPAVWYAGQVLSLAARCRLEAVRGAPAALGAVAADAGYSLRTLLRRPGYLAAGVLTLGIGTGGVALVYSAAHWVLLRDVPGVGTPQELAWVRLESTEAEIWGGTTWGIMDPDLERMAAGMPSLVALEASRQHAVHLQVRPGATPTRETAALVTPGYFRVLDMRPAVGRFFTPEDHRNGAGPAEVVMGYDLWRRAWSGDRDVVGAEVQINGQPFTVIGVAPRGFRGAELPGTHDLWLASSAFGTVRPAEAAAGIGQATQLWDHLVGRRAPGASVAEVQRQANAVMELIRTERAGQMHSFLATHFVFRVYDGIGLNPGIRAEARRTLSILLGGSLLLLLLAVANVANLGLTRAASRRDMHAVRRALGGGGWRVAREPLVEGAIVGTLGGVFGVGLLLAGTGLLGGVTLVASDASLEGMTVGPTVVMLAFLVSLLAGLASGCGPALGVWRERSSAWLRGKRRSDRSQTRTRSALVVCQVAVSVALLVGAGLFGRTVLKLNAIDLGVARDAYVFSIDPGLNHYDESESREVLARVREGLWRRLGPQGAGLVWPGPMNGWRITGAVRAAGAPDDALALGSTFWTSGSGFFQAAGLTLLAGEGFEQDLRVADGSAHPVVLSESMARAVFPNESLDAMVGRRVVVGRDPFESTVAGVVSDARMVGPLQPPIPTVFVPWQADWSDGSGTFVVDARAARRDTRAVVDAVLGEVDSGLPAYGHATLGQKADVLLSGTRVISGLATALGAVGVLLVSLGLYGVLSYAVNERAHEFGVRAALGATGGTLRRSVLGWGLRLAAAGLVLGVPLALWMSRFVESRLYELSRLDGPTYGAGVLVIVGVAVVASWAPAVRATRASPVEALRDE